MAPALFFFVSTLLAMGLSLHLQRPGNKTSSTFMDRFNPDRTGQNFELKSIFGQNPEVAHIEASSRLLSEQQRALSSDSHETLPPGLRFQIREERNYLKLHRCKDTGEGYAAAYLTTREHLLYQFTGYNLSWVNCEMASFIMLRY